MRITKLFAGASLLIAAALVGGTLIGSTLAAPSGSTDSAAPLADDTDTDTDAAAYCDVFLDTFAAELGVSRDELLPAGKAAASAAIDAAAADGRISEERAAAMKERIDAFSGDGCGLLGGWKGAFGRGHGIGMGRGLDGVTPGLGRIHAGINVIGEAASALGLELAELREQVAAGSSLSEIAAAQGLSYDDVKAAILDAAGSALDTAVANGMPQDRADAVLERLTTWLDEGGELPSGPFGHGRGNGLGWGRGGPFGDR